MERPMRDFLEAVQVALDCDGDHLAQRRNEVYSAVGVVLDDPARLERMTAWLRDRIGGDAPR